MTIVNSDPRVVEIRAVPSGLPAWFTAINENEWALAPNSGTLDDPGVDARQSGFSIPPSGADQWRVTHPWCGATAREDYFMFVASGGHKASYDNSVYSYGPFTDENPTWSRILDPTQPLVERGTAQSWEADGKPASRHGYWNECYIPALGTNPERGRRWFSAICGAPSGEVTGTRQDTQTLFFTSDIDDNAVWDPQGYNQDHPNSGQTSESGGCAWDPNTQRVYFIDIGGGTGKRFRSYDPVTRTWSGTIGAQINPRTAGIAIDPAREIICVIGKSGSLTSAVDRMHIFDLSSANFGDIIEPPVTGINGINGSDFKPSVEYEPVGGTFVTFASQSNGSFQKCTPPANYRDGGGALDPSVTWNWVQHTTQGSPELPDSSERPYNGNFTKCRYISSIGAFALQVNGIGNMWVYRVPSGGM